MRSAIFVSAAMLLAQGVMAQYDVFCGVICQDLVHSCCGGNGGDCGKLSTCGANRNTGACGNAEGACVTYCSEAGTKECINSV